MQIRSLGIRVDGNSHIGRNRTFDGILISFPTPEITDILCRFSRALVMVLGFSVRATQLVAHIGWTIWFVLIAVAGATGNQSLAGAVQPLSMYLLDVSCLTGPNCLFLTRYGLGLGCLVFWTDAESKQNFKIESQYRLARRNRIRSCT